jgi:hypothetical protein
MRGNAGRHLEARIDSAIRGAAEHDDARVTIGTVGIPSHVVAEVVSKYVRAGWDMKAVDDSRDGNFISVVFNHE